MKILNALTITFWIMQDLESKFANFIREENVQDVFLIGPKTPVDEGLSCSFLRLLNMVWVD